MKGRKRERKSDYVNPNGLGQKIRDFFYDISVGVHNRLPKKNVKSATKGKRNEALFFHLLIILPLLQFALMYVYVNINSVLLAFQTYDVFTGKFVLNAGFSNFQTVFAELFSSSGTLGVAFKNSVTMYLVSLLVVMPLALLFSYYMYKKNFLTETFRVILFLPSIITPVVLASIYMILMDQGVPSLLQKIQGGDLQLGLISRDDTRFTTLLCFYVLTCFGTNVLMYTNAMSQISESVVEAAQLDGASMLQEFFYISLPLIYPTLTTFLTVGIVDIFVGQMHLFAFFGGGAEISDYTIGYYLYILSKDKSATSDMYPFAATMGIIFSLVAIPVTLVLRWAFEKFGPQTDM